MNILTGDSTTASNIHSFSHPSQSDVQAVKALLDEQASHAKYAAYYYAMNFMFLPESSHIAKNGNDEIAAAITGMYDFQFKTLLVTHIATALERCNAETRKELLLTNFKAAADKGAETVSATLDIDPDQELADAVTEAAHVIGLNSEINFRGVRHDQPDSIDLPEAFDNASVSRDDIIYRHPTLADAHGMWSLVAGINYAAKVDPNKSGLDLYGLSNYERLCRDTPETCAVAEHDGRIVGFATGFMMPHDGLRGLFLWQTGVHEGYQGKGIGTKVEQLVLDRVKPDHAMWTVEGSNGAANRTAEKKAIYMNMGYEQPGAITTETLGNGHEAEVMYLVAPDNVRPQVRKLLLG